MKITNSQELDAWIFDHVNTQGHRCDSIKGPLQRAKPGETPPEEFNLAWVDTVTGERIDVIYDDA
jgi:hypothetical protein